MNNKYSMSNPMNYDLKGLIHSSKDKQVKVMKLKHKQFDRMLAAKVYTIMDPENTGHAKKEAVIQ